MAKKTSKEISRMGYNELPLRRNFKNKPQQIVIDGKTYNFRSILESKVAQYLQLLKDSGHIKNWAYEQTRFEFPDDSYLVDFDIINNDGTLYYIEVKGYCTAKTKRNLRLLNKYRPEIVIDMIFQNTKDIKKLGLASKYCRRICLLRELTKGII